MLPLRSNLHTAIATNSFWWAAGIEDSFIADPWHRSGRSLDEYELTEHYQRWREDLDLIHALGLRAARYGLPWHRICPSPHQRDWSWSDRVMERMHQLGIEPILDLVHYGVPSWLDQAFLDPCFPERMAEHASEVAARYPWIRWHTPLNEPRIAAWYSGRLGWWPPYRASSRGFAQVLLATCRGILLTQRALRHDAPETVIVHVDAGDLYIATDDDLIASAEFRQQMVFLGLDLICGKVDGYHPLRSWLLAQEITPDQLDWFREHADIPDIIGVNMYPMFTLKEVGRRGQRIRVRMPYATGELVDRMIEAYWQRYQRPIMITETASRGAVARRQQWLEQSVLAVARLRRRGIPVVGFTWWPLFGLIAWSYRQGSRELDTYIQQMGLWDLLRDSEGGLARVPTEVAEAYRNLVAHGAAAVGDLLAA